jgi:hypothetical protein
MLEVAMKQVTMIEEEDEPKTTYVSTTPSKKHSTNLQETCIQANFGG